MNRVTRWAGLVCLCWLAMATALAADLAVSPQAPDAPPGELILAIGAEDQPTAELLAARLAAVEARADLAETVRLRAVASYQAAIEHVERAAAAVAAAEQFRAAAEASQAAVNEAERRAAELDAAEPIAPPEPGEATVEELSRWLTAAEANETAATERLAMLDRLLLQMTDRPVEAQRELTLLRQQLTELDAAPTVVPGEAAVLAEARQAAQAALRQALLADIDRVQQDLSSLPARQSVAQAERELASAQVTAARAEVEALRRWVADARRLAAERERAIAADVTRRLGDAPAWMVEYATQTQTLADRTIEALERVDGIAAERVRVAQQQELLSELQWSADQVLAIGATGAAYARLLRDIRAQLPRETIYFRQIAGREQQTISARLDLLQTNEQLRRLADPEQAAAALIQTRPTAEGIDPDTRAAFVEIVAARAQTLARLADAQERLVISLADITAEKRALTEATASLGTRLDERLLWLASTTPIGRTWLGEVAAGLQWITSPAEWWLVLQSLARRALQEPVTTLLVLGTAGLLLSRRRWLWDYLERMGERVGDVFSDSFIYTLQTLVVTLLLAAPVSLLIGFAGWLLRTDPAAPPMGVSVGDGLISVASVLFLLRILQVMDVEHGLFARHFGWSERTRSVIIHELRWFIWFVPAPAFLVAAAAAAADPQHHTGLGRLAFLVGSIGVAVFVYRAIHPQRGATAEFLALHGRAWRLRRVWFPLLFAAPLLLAAAAAYGYYETAISVQARLFTTGWLAVVGVVLYSMALRWIVVAHRRLAVQRVREAREKLKAARAAKEASEGSGEAAPYPVEMPEVDLSSVNAQTRTLLRVSAMVIVAVGVWGVWRDLVPALAILEGITLWTQTVVVDGAERIDAISLRDLLLALVIATLTLIAAQNVPGLLEMSALQRLSIDPGSRYAITAVTRYVIVLIGVVLALDQIGVTWGRMQWIVAALGVGLGFGLQEIVANFVSGLIILFERPVRVGDTVTVADLSGTVTRIQIRATTIVDWDNREIIVPNKQFITERVINWTLSESITRLVLKVGVAYGSDAAEAHRVLLETVKAHPMVLESPKPAVFFLGFGDSSLDFEVRFFVRELSERIPTMHEMHMAIHRALREHNIEIPFPQRDIYIRRVSRGEG
jgi:potassium efflux system protein